MIPTSLINYQHSQQIIYLESLNNQCRSRFHSAARLIGVNPSQWPLMLINTNFNPNIHALRDFWVNICNRYNKEFYEPQMDFLSPQDTPEIIFNKFINSKLFPFLISEDEVVRSILKLTGLLPTQDQNSVNVGLIAIMKDWHPNNRDIICNHEYWIR